MIWSVLSFAVLSSCRNTPKPPSGPPPIPVSPCEGKSLTVQTTLDSWGLSRLDQVGHASLGVLHQTSGDRLVLYLLQRRPPPPLPPTRARSHQPQLDQGRFIIDRFSGGNVNRLGGYFSAFARTPSHSTLTLGRTGPDRRRGLVFSYGNKPSPAFAGFWIHLFDTKALPQDRIFLDTRQLQFLTFAIRGARGGESLVLKVADRNWEQKGDALPVGPVAEFLPQRRLSQTWQQAWVPLQRLPARLQRQELASIVFVVRGKQRGRIYLRDLALTTTAEVPLPPPPPPVHAHPRPLHRAMWLWKTEELLREAQEIQTLVRFCQEQQLTHLYLQLPLVARRAAGRWSVSLIEQGLPQLITALHRVGVHVEALDGDPHFALEENHERVLESIRQVIAYNQRAPRTARFVGVRYDNEPYLLPGFAGVRKVAILRQYLQLLRRARQLTSQAGLTLGVDIPFWFDARDETQAQAVVLDGRPFSEWILDAVDQISIMDYRTQAYGPDGIIAHAAGELSYAAKQGKQVLVGLETVALPDETSLEFAGQGDGPGPRLVLRASAQGALHLALIPGADWPRCQGEVQKLPGARILDQRRMLFIPASKLTFAQRSVKELQAVIEQTTRELLPWPSFVGLAFHSYESYRPWLIKEQ